MDDLEITRRCAEAMGEEHRTAYDWDGEPYNPLTDDAQAMALVKRFRIDLECCSDSDEIYWSAYIMENGHVAYSFVDPDLNRAICVAVAMRGTDG